MKYKLVCFDVDGTLVDNIEFSWQLFHEFFGVDQEVRDKAKKDFFEGNISYEEWALHDIGLWKEMGAKKSDFFEALKKADVKLMSGCLETLSELKNKGVKLAIVSGTLSVILEYVLPNYKELFDDAFLSTLSFDDKGNIKEVVPTKFDMAEKASALKNIAEKEGFSLSECAFVGDHHNDVEIAKAAGFSVAFNAKDDELMSVSDMVVEKKDLRELLHFL